MTPMGRNQVNRFPKEDRVTRGRCANGLPLKEIDRMMKRAQRRRGAYE
jgi:hypothetical protein